MQIMPTMVSVFTPYKAIAGDRRYVKNAGEHRAFLREFGYEEVGTDRSMAPPETSPEEDAHVRAHQVNELERDQAEVGATMRRMGVNFADLDKTLGEE